LAAEHAEARVGSQLGLAVQAEPTEGRPTIKAEVGCRWIFRLAAGAAHHSFLLWQWDLSLAAIQQNTPKSLTNRESPD
jgi:hypothetical protein